FPVSIFWKRSFVDCCALRTISSDRLGEQGWYRSFLPNRVSHHQVKSRANGQSRDKSAARRTNSSVDGHGVGTASQIKARGLRLSSSSWTRLSSVPLQDTL